MSSAARTYSPIAPRAVAFLGLGVMGHPMAGHLARAGHRVTVYNRTEARAQSWVQDYGGRSAATPREAAGGASIVFACVGNDDDLRCVVLGENGALAGMKRGATVIAHDPQAGDNARHDLPTIELVADPAEALRGADIGVLGTEWPMYHDLDWAAIHPTMRTPIIIDGRRLLDGDRLRALGYRYEVVGTASRG